MQSSDMTRPDLLRDDLIRQVRRMRKDEGLAVARTFYAELFSRCPDLAKYFAGLDVESLAAKLWNVLRLVAAGDQSGVDLRAAATRVARRHEIRGVAPSHYALFTSVLVDVLAHCQRTLPPEVARGIWSKELEPITAMIMARHV
ncbi:MAG: globin [Proteobacteria bacterium]|nr:globin [Pseudomonadota bacterium]